MQPFIMKGYIDILGMMISQLLQQQTCTHCSSNLYRLAACTDGR